MLELIKVIGLILCFVILILVWLFSAIIAWECVGGEGGADEK